jgi:hypothetical protein
MRYFKAMVRLLRTAQSQPTNGFACPITLLSVISNHCFKEVQGRENHLAFIIFKTIFTVLPSAGVHEKNVCFNNRINVKSTCRSVNL